MFDAKTKGKVTNRRIVLCIQYYDILITRYSRVTENQQEFSCNDLSIMIIIYQILSNYLRNSHMKCRGLRRSSNRHKQFC